MKPTPERAQPMYTESEPVCVPADQVVPAVTALSVGVGELESLLRRLLLTAPPPRPVPTEIMLKRLISNGPAPAPPPRTAITDMETMLQRLLTGTPTWAPLPQPVPIRYGVPFGLGSTVLVPGPMVFNMEGNRPGLCRPRSSPASRGKASTMGKFFPPWTVARKAWNAALMPTVSGIATDIMLFSQHGPDWFTGTMCMEVMCRIALFKDRSC